MQLVLIFNPASGGGRGGRTETIARLVDTLRSLGHTVHAVQTEAAGSAATQARQAAEAGADVVFACGGDGTVHETMQGLVSSRVGAAALGIVPMGSANALARHLGIPLDPVEAALAQLRGSSDLISVGKVEFAGGSRYFAAMAGAGPDGTLVYELAMESKSQGGRFAYYLHALRLFATRRFRPFALQYTDAVDGCVVSMLAVCAMAVRVGSLGGPFHRLTGPPERSDSGGLRLVLVRPPACISLPAWFAFSWLGLRNPLVRRVVATEFSCLPIGSRAAHVEADGEWLGRLPIRVSIVPDALRILRP